MIIDVLSSCEHSLVFQTLVPDLHPSWRPKSESDAGIYAVSVAPPGLV